jgi:hypothetical protein
MLKRSVITINYNPPLTRILKALAYLNSACDRTIR